MLQYESLCYIWLLFVLGFVCPDVVCFMLWCVLSNKDRNTIGCRMYVVLNPLMIVFA
jgi:hypothetical protein